MMGMEDVYRDAFLRWDSYFTDGMCRNNDFIRFDTSPVKNAYWKLDCTKKPYIWREKIIPKSKSGFNLINYPIPKMVKELFGHGRAPETSGDTLIFRRYGNLVEASVPYEMDILLSSFLGIPQTFVVKRNSNHAILNDSWTVNLKSFRENIMMDAFLRGFGTEFSDLKKQWDGTPPHGYGEKQMGIDVSEELKDLFKVYTDANAHLESKEKTALNYLVNTMESFLSVHKEKIKVANKLITLQYKLKENSGCDCDDEGEDDE